jgi:hypothetical protein
MEKRDKGKQEREKDKQAMAAASLRRIRILSVVAMERAVLR